MYVCLYAVCKCVRACDNTYFKLKRTNYKNATCDDYATMYAVAPRGFQSRGDSSSDRAPLDLF